MFLLCLHYASKLATFNLLQLSRNILISECSIRVFHYKSDCLINEYQSKELCTMDLILLQFAVSTDCSIRKYRSIFMEYSLK